MPDFLLPAEPGGLTSLSNLLAEGPVVISFNRGHWCSYCSIELRALAEAERRIAAAGAKVAVIMPDLPQFMQPTVVETSGKFTFLSDVDNGYALEIGLVMWVGDHLAGLMRADKLNLPSFQGNDSWFLPLPATFVVGRDGIILARFVHPDFRRRLNVEAIVAALERAT